MLTEGLQPVSNVLAINSSCVHMPHVWNWVSSSAQLQCPALAGVTASSHQPGPNAHLVGGHSSPRPPALPWALTKPWLFWERAMVWITWPPAPRSFWFQCRISVLVVDYSNNGRKVFHWKWMFCNSEKGVTHCRSLSRRARATSHQHGLQRAAAFARVVPKLPGPH